MAKAYKWEKEQIDGKYAVKCLNGKLSKSDSFKDAEKLAIDIYKKFNKLNRKFES